MNGREILVGVSGGIAAYKTAELVSLCVQAGAGVSVIMTRAACHFVGTTTFEALTGRPVHTDMFRAREHFRGEHIALPQRAELCCIAPASADLLAKLAHGLADDLLSTALLAGTAPVLLAPAMNREMWSKRAVQRNLKQLLEDGFEIIEPQEGWLSCGQVGPGRMAEPADIFQRLQQKLTLAPEP